MYPVVGKSQGSCRGEYGTVLEAKDSLATACKFEVVGYEHKCDARCPVQVKNEIRYPRRSFAVKIACWLIGKKEARAIGEGSGKGDTLLFAAA